MIIPTYTERNIEFTKSCPFFIFLCFFFFAWQSFFYNRKSTYWVILQTLNNFLKSCEFKPHLEWNIHEFPLPDGNPLCLDGVFVRSEFIRQFYIFIFNSFRKTFDLIGNSLLSGISTNCCHCQRRADRFWSALYSLILVFLRSLCWRNFSEQIGTFYIQDNNPIKYFVI